MARRRKKRSLGGLGYGCPCVVKTKSRVVCAMVPVRKGSRKYKKVCRTPGGQITSSVVGAKRRSRGKRLSARRAGQMRRFRAGASRRRLKG